MEYSSQIAKHYKAYRPPLHQVILKQCLDGKDQFTKALDIGCGVGHSSIALLPYCETIIGVDSSHPMLEEALEHKHISYELLSSLPFRWENGEFEMIAFAGSLFYCKSDELIQECLRLLTNTGIIVVYDFTVNLNPILISLGLRTEESNYDPTVNLDDVLNLQLTHKMHQKHTVFISLENLVHILYTDTNIIEQLGNQISAEENTASAIQDILLNKISHHSISCEAELFCRIYHKHNA